MENQNKKDMKASSQSIKENLDYLKIIACGLSSSDSTKNKFRQPNHATLNNSKNRFFNSNNMELGLGYDNQSGMHMMSSEQFESVKIKNNFGGAIKDSRKIKLFDNNRPPGHFGSGDYWKINESSPDAVQNTTENNFYKKLFGNDSDRYIYDGDLNKLRYTAPANFYSIQNSTKVKKYLDDIGPFQSTLSTSKFPKYTLNDVKDPKSSNDNNFKKIFGIDDHLKTSWKKKKPASRKNNDNDDSEERSKKKNYHQMIFNFGGSFNFLNGTSSSAPTENDIGPQKMTYDEKTGFKRVEPEESKVKNSDQAYEEGSNDSLQNPGKRNDQIVSHSHHQLKNLNKLDDNENNNKKKLSSQGIRNSAKSPIKIYERIENLKREIYRNSSKYSLPDEIQDPKTSVSYAISQINQGEKPYEVKGKREMKDSQSSEYGISVDINNGLPINNLIQNANTDFHFNKTTEYNNHPNSANNINSNGLDRQEVFVGLNKKLDKVSKPKSKNNSFSNNNFIPAKKIPSEDQNAFNFNQKGINFKDSFGNLDVEIFHKDGEYHEEPSQKIKSKSGRKIPVTKKDLKKNIDNLIAQNKGLADRQNYLVSNKYIRSSTPLFDEERIETSESIERINSKIHEYYHHQAQ